MYSACVRTQTDYRREMCSRRVRISIVLYECCLLNCYSLTINRRLQFITSTLIIFSASLIQTVFVLLLHRRLAPPSSSCSFIFVLLLHLRLAPPSSYCSFIVVLPLHLRLVHSSSSCSSIFVLLLHIRLAPSS